MRMPIMVANNLNWAASRLYLGGSGVDELDAGASPGGISIDSLAKARLLIVTGKGGVGKTTICGALSLAAQRAGKRVLLVEVGTKENISALFGADPLGYDPKPLTDGIDGMLLDPYLALQEYMVGQIKIKAVVRFVVENNVFRYLVGVAPGWRELITLGKIWVMEGLTRGKRDTRPLYDLVVVDAPATGHGISFLKVPKVVLDVLKFGPIKHYTKMVQGLLLDEKRTRLLIVSLPEEMPVNEALEIYHASRDFLKIPLGPLLLNCMYPALGGPGLESTLKKLERGNGPKLPSNSKELINANALKAAARAYQERRRVQLESAQRLESEVDLNVVHIPYVFTNRFDLDTLKRISGFVGGPFDAGEEDSG